MQIKSTLHRVLFVVEMAVAALRKALRAFSAACFVFYAEKLCFANFSIICGFDYRIKKSTLLGAFYGGTIG